VTPDRSDPAGALGAFFQTDAQSVPILRRQRDDAASHGDHPRMRLYDELVRVIDQQHTATDD
jgi:hypothetical protein